MVTAVVVAVVIGEVVVGEGGGCDGAGGEICAPDPTALRFLCLPGKTGVGKAPDFLLLLPVMRISSCLHRSAFVLAAIS